MATGNLAKFSPPSIGTSRAGMLIWVAFKTCTFWNANSTLLLITCPQNSSKIQHYHLEVQATPQKIVQKTRFYFQHLWEKRYYPMTYFKILTSSDNSLPGCLGIIVTCTCTVLLYFCCDKRQIWLFFKEIVSLQYFAYLSP